MRAFGQGLNPESHAICKADMLIKGQDVSNIKFDYMLSNPPFGVDWKKIEGDIADEHKIDVRDWQPVAAKEDVGVEC